MKSRKARMDIFRIQNAAPYAAAPCSCWSKEIQFTQMPKEMSLDRGCQRGTAGRRGPVKKILEASCSRLRPTQNPCQHRAPKANPKSSREAKSVTGRRRELTGSTEGIDAVLVLCSEEALLRRLGRRPKQRLVSFSSLIAYVLSRPT